LHCSAPYGYGWGPGNIKLKQGFASPYVTPAQIQMAQIFSHAAPSGPLEHTYLMGLIPVKR